MAKFFIERPIFAIVLAVVITAIGLIAAFNLPIAQYPEIAPPVVNVSTAYQGANADVVNQTVAQVIEQQINGVEGMVSMQSTSSDGGMYSLNVQFEPGKNADLAAVQTQNRVALATASLPQDVQQNGITTQKSSEDFAMFFALWSPHNSYSTVFMKNYGSIYLIDNIKRVKGVGNVMAFDADFSMRIWLQPEKMARLGVTTSDISDAISKQNVQAPAGAIGQSPGVPGQDFQYTARVKGTLDDAAQFGNIIVRSKDDGSFIRLKDVARVELGSRDYSYSNNINGHPGAVFGLQLTSDANALETIGNVQKVIADATKRFPADLKYKTIVDETEFVRQSMLEVCKTFAKAICLVLLVVFLFLQSWRATLIPMLAIPVSLIGTFGAFLLLGFSINTLTLFAMVLSIGLVVDDAIVVIEAVEHHLRYSGLSPVDATKRAMSEVSGPVVAIAFVLAAVFIPVAFFGGIIGVLYKQFALTIAVSMALSATVALSLTPALCALLLKPYDPEAHGGFVGRFFARFNTWFDRMVERYGGRLGKLIPRARYCLGFLVLVVIMTVCLFNLLPSGFVPDEDQGWFIAAANLPEGASLNRTKDVMNKLSEGVRTRPGVEDVIAISGFDLLGGGTKPNAGVLFIGLKPWSERTTPDLAVGAKVGEVFMLGSRLPEANVFAFNPPALPGLGMVGGFSLMLENKMGLSPEAMEQISTQFIAAAQQRPEIGMINSTYQIDTPGYQFAVDRDKAEKLGVPVNDVFNALQTFLGGVVVNDFNQFGRTYKVVMQAEPEFRSDVEDTRFLYLRSSTGTMVPLNTLIKPEPVNASSTITRYNGFPAIQISGSPAPGYSSGQAIAALEAVAAQTLPDGFGYEWAGQSREEIVSGNKAPILFGLAIFFVFLCLAALYESWTIPFAVLLAMPTGIFGAFLFQFLRNYGALLFQILRNYGISFQWNGTENCVYMQIGLIMLIGLAAKNAILIVEFAKIRVDRGMEPVQAAIEAAKIRLRPILMTSMSLIFGCLPLVLATGAGAFARNAMGTAVVGGMIMATGLGIFLVPVFFVVVEKFAAWLQRRREKRRNIAA